MVIACLAAIVTAPWRVWRGGRRHLEHVGVERAGGLVDRERGEALDLRLGGDHRDPDGVVLLRGAGGDLGGADGVGVVGQDHDLGSAGADDGLEEHAGRGSPTGCALDHDRAGVAEQPGEAWAGGHRHDPAAGPFLGALRGRLDLLGEVGDADPVGSAGGEAGLDRGPDVVDVDMDVPQPLTADHHEGVAERRQVALEPLDRRRVVAVEEIHHLVRRAALGQVVDLPWSPGWSGRRAGVAGADPAACR